MNLFKGLVFLFAFGTAITAVAQDDFDADPDVLVPLSDDAPRFYMGANVGAYFANRSTAEYYNGDGSNTFGVEWIWTGNNPNGTVNRNYDNIKTELGELEFELGELPDSMRYKPGLITGVNMGYMLNARAGIFLDVNIVKITLVDVVTLSINDPNNQLLEPTIQQTTLIGEEKRLSINLGYRAIFPGANPQAAPYLEIGANFNSTKPTKNELHIGNLTYDILPPENSSYYGPQQLGGSGIGGLIGGGLHYKMNNNFRFDLGGNVKMEKIVLLSEIEQGYAVQFTLFARFLFL
jgi:hypothetical protein